MDDLGLPAEAVTESLDALTLRAPIIKRFRDLRSAHPEGQETLRGLTSKIVGFTLHSGEDRGITWHDAKYDAVWLLGAHFHRSGKPDDAYPYFRELDRKGSLLPTPDDYVALSESRRYQFAVALTTEVTQALTTARSRPGEIVHCLIGRRVRVRLLVESDADPGLTLLYLAVSMHLLPEDIEMPEPWFPVIVAAFFPKNAVDVMARCLATSLGEHPLQSDEIAFCDFDWRG